MSRKFLLIPILLLLLALLIVPAVPVTAADPVNLVLGGDGATPWAIGPITPGQNGQVQVTVQNAGNASGNLSIWFDNIINTEGTPDDFETHTPGDLGELASFVTLSLSSAQVTQLQTIYANYISNP